MHGRLLQYLQSILADEPARREDAGGEVDRTEDALYGLGPAKQ